MHIPMAEGQDAPRSQHIAPPLPDEELSRARGYQLLARLLAAAPDGALLAALAAIPGDDSELGQAFTALSRAAQRATSDLVVQEYHDLFIGLTRGELLPYGSYYLTGFLNEKPLAELRSALAALGVARAPG